MQISCEESAVKYRIPDKQEICIVNCGEKFLFFQNFRAKQAGDKNLPIFSFLWNVLYDSFLAN